MSTFLFDKIIFGPVASRRLGISLGINLLPINRKVCNFNCIYCECGLTSTHLPGKSKFHSREEIYTALNDKLAQMKKNHEPITSITYAGNGEPTLHPSFAEIIDDSIKLRDQYFPDVEIAVLSNSTTLQSEKIFNALKKIEKNILKLDSAIQETAVLLNQPFTAFKINDVINHLKKFNGNFILQTLFIQGSFKGKIVDNTTDKEINAWLDAIRKIEPKEIMIYTIERDTPFPDLFKVKKEKLNEIAEKVRELNIKVTISE